MTQVSLYLLFLYKSEASTNNLKLNDIPVTPKMVKKGMPDIDYSEASGQD